MAGRPTPVELPDEARELFGCPDCDSDVTAVKQGGVLQVNVAHDDSCPWHQQQSAGRPFTRLVAYRPDAAKGG